MFNEKPYVIVIDRGGNLFKIKEKTMQKCFDKIIAPLDIINQIGNESEMELVHELNIDYVKKLENGLIKALDELSQKEDNFDYYDKLRELTDFGNYQALDFLDMFSDNEEGIDYGKFIKKTRISRKIL